MWWCEIYSSWLTQAIYSRSVRAEDGLPQRIEEARRDWVHAQCYYNCVTEPELLDYAIYLIKVTELKYTYLLKKAKREGIKYSRYLQCEN